MSTNTSDNKALHLPDLWIKGFRGIKDLKISRLGHVTLFAGKNGAGKTTVLDAVRVYAARGRNSILMDILGTREELVQTVDEDGDQVFTSNWEALFFGRHISYGTFISIGSIDNMDTLAIDTTPMEEVYEVWEDLLPDYIAEEDVHILRVKYGDNEMTFPSTLLASQLPGARSWRQRNRMRSISTEKDLPPAILCASLGPSLLNNQNISRFWDTVALTEDETRAVQALQLIFGDIVQRVSVIGGDRPLRFGGRRAVVKLKGTYSPVPLKSLGDGAVRLFGVALALANSRGGFLTIDEAENGIHHSVQYDFWRMVLQTAYENNVQVFATTHSDDCVKGFAQAAADLEEVEGALVRIDRDDDDVYAVEYSEEGLRVAAEQGIEVR